MRPNPTLEPLSAELVDFFARRGISQATLDRGGVMQVRLKPGLSSGLARALMDLTGRGHLLIGPALKGGRR